LLAVAEVLVAVFPQLKVTVVQEQVVF